MNDQEVERQIDQMVRFIQQEAQEKASEIGVSAEEEFNIEKLQLLDKEKAKVRSDYERREGQIEVKKKIEYSKQLNESRLKVLAAREAAVQKLVDTATEQINALTKDGPKYKAMLLDLIVQALGKLREESAVLKVREVDVALVEGLLAEAKAKYAKVFGKEAPEVTLDKKAFLPPPPGKSKDPEAVTCAGGVVASSSDGRIVCSNTLDERLKIAYTQTLPEIRSTLFGAHVRA